MDAQLLEKMNAYWRACNYLSVGMIYLRENPLLREPLRPEHIKNRLLGHWGSDAGMSLVWVHLNRIINQGIDRNFLFVAGPGHGAPAILANTYLEGTYSEVFPDKSLDEHGMCNFFHQFSFPGGIGSHCTPETPGSIHEGGELGYSLSHSYGIAFDNPDTIVACIVGDGESETGPLATSWHSNKFLNPKRDGAVLPILHLNGYKIANPTILARIPDEELHSLFVGYGYEPFVVAGDDPMEVHQKMAATLDKCMEIIQNIQHDARNGGENKRPKWPMIILRTPKGWTGPKEVDGHKVENFWRAHQVPITKVQDPTHLKAIEDWLRSYKPEELFEEDGSPKSFLRELAPKGDRRISANPIANGGIIRQELDMPDFRKYGVHFDQPGTLEVENTRPLGVLLRDVMRDNMHNFRVFGPDETASNKLDDVYEVSKKAWMAGTLPEDLDGSQLDPEGRVMEMLSEHTLEGWLEGYLLSGRHGFFSSYEAFIHVIGSMFNQHAKWLEKSKEMPWRAPVSSLNILITSTVWRQDHNGFSHQDPGFLDLVTNKSADIVRIYLPPDVNTLLSTADHCLRSRDYVNIIVSDKQKHLQYLTMDEAIVHCTKGIGIWDWASNDHGTEPDVVMACAGDIPTMESLAATAILREHFPELKIRFVNVVDLFRLVPHTEHPHGLTDRDFDSLFTTDKHVMFNFHGYPWLIHRLTYRFTNHKNFHVRGYKEKGNINTPMDLAIKNQIDRFNLVIDVIDRVPGLQTKGAHVKEKMKNEILTNVHYAYEHGVDHPDIINWKWPYPKTGCDC